MSTELEEKATAVTVVEQSSPLITIEPAKYVALVFEPFAKRLAAAKEVAKTITFDIATTSGMRAAVEQRAVFRDIRVGSEKARKERKAPILEIGKLLDGRQKEIEAEIEPYESKYDDAIKAEEKRKDDEKIAKALAESQRITAIRQKIDAFRSAPQKWLNKPSAEIGAAAERLSESVISPDVYAEYVGEADQAKTAALGKLSEMRDEALAREQEAARVAAQLEADRIEHERVAEANRVESERLAKLAREIEVRDAAARAEQEQRQREADAARTSADLEASDRRAEADRVAAAERAAAQRILDEQAAALRKQQEAADKIAREARETEERRVAAAAAEEERIAREAREAEQVRLNAEATERRRAEQAEADARRAAEEAAHAAQQKLRNAAPGLLAAAQEALAVIKKIKPEGNGNGTIVRLEAAIAAAID